MYPILAIVCLSQLAGAALRFPAVGDWGDLSPIGMVRQENVAEIMDQWCEAQPDGCDFVMATGDNIYPDGPISPDDIRLTNRWKNVYDGDSIANLTWLMSLGNHDHHNDNEVNSLEYHNIEPRWYLPWLWYGEEMAVGDDTTALFYCIDTEALRKPNYDTEEQLSALEEALANSDAEWKIVFGHHPPLSVGRRWGDQIVLDEVTPILREYDVDAFIAGHDHNLQHIVRSEDLDIEYVVSGAGGRGNYEYTEGNEDIVRDLGYEPLFFTDNYGFTGVTISGNTMRVEYFTYDSSIGDDNVTIVPLYSFTRHHVH